RCRLENAIKRALVYVTLVSDLATFHTVCPGLIRLDWWRRLEYVCFPSEAPEGARRTLLRFNARLNSIVCDCVLNRFAVPVYVACKSDHRPRSPYFRLRSVCQKR